MVPRCGNAPPSSTCKEDVLLLNYRGKNLVPALGIEPSSTALQTAAMTTSAKLAFGLDRGIEPSLPVSQTGVQPLH
jgi:hypothetical protein